MGRTIGIDPKFLQLSDAPVVQTVGLRDKNISATITNVYAIRLASNQPGAAAEIVRLVTQVGVEIKYMYSFLFGGCGIVVIRPDSPDKAEEAIMLNQLDYITENELK